MNNIAIKADNLGKQYRIGSLKASYKTLRESLVETATAPFRRAGKLLSGQAYGAAELDETIWALRNVSLEVRQGEVMGIIGHNGAGKSTLLKVLSRISCPTEGNAMIYGRLGSLLEIGTGFHPELTGRENIYLNGAIIGMKKREIALKFDEIVAFAEIEKFIDTPVKHYSSGMYVRLAFAVAAHLEADILLVDEVLAVGDISFQKKCLGKMSNVAREGRTIIFVSHNMGAISSLCESACIIDNGRLIFKGDVEQAILLYTSDFKNSDTMKWEGDEGDENIRLLRSEVRSLDPKGYFHHAAPVEVKIEIAILQTVNGLHLGFTLFSEYNSELAYVLYDDNDEPPQKTVLPGKYIKRFVIPAYTLGQGHYRIELDIGIAFKKKIIKETGSLYFYIENSSGFGAAILPNKKGYNSILRPHWCVNSEKPVDAYTCNQTSTDTISHKSFRKDIEARVEYL